MEYRLRHSKTLEIEQDDDGNLLFHLRTTSFSHIFLGNDQGALELAALLLLSVRPDNVNNRLVEKFLSDCINDAGLPSNPDSLFALKASEIISDCTKALQNIAKTDVLKS